MFRRNEVDVVDVADLLELDIPLSQFFGGQVKPLALVSNILSTKLVFDIKSGDLDHNLHDSGKRHSEDCTPRKRPIRCRGSPEYTAPLHDVARSR